LNAYPELPQEEEIEREFIWDFKNGERSEEAAKLIANGLYRKLRFIEGLESLYTFCIIPASTEDKTIDRFFHFSECMVNYLGLENGFDFIKVIEDHEPTKGEKEKDVMQYLEFDEDNIKGKTIILFDDVITSGETFYQCAKQLKTLGARHVIGTFLGNTANATK
jgi:ATP-dependent DNA helicase RecQ